MEVKGTIWAKGSMSFGGVIAFEHHGNSIQSPFWCLQPQQETNYLIYSQCNVQSNLHHYTKTLPQILSLGIRPQLGGFQEYQKNRGCINKYRIKLVAIGYYFKYNFSNMSYFEQEKMRTICTCQISIICGVNIWFPNSFPFWNEAKIEVMLPHKFIPFK